MLGVVLHPLPTTADRDGRRLWFAWRRRPRPRACPAPAEITISPPLLARPDVQLEPLVGLVEDQHVLVVRRADSVPPHLERPVGVVVDGVEEVVGRRAPRAAVVAARHLVVQVGAALQVAEAQPVDLVARPVDGVGQQVLVRADHGEPELEVRRVVGEEVGVQEDLTRPLRGR